MLALKSISHSHNTCVWNDCYADVNILDAAIVAENDIRSRSWTEKKRIY